MKSKTVLINGFGKGTASAVPPRANRAVGFIAPEGLGGFPLRFIVRWLGL
jgi:hypothetical protein